MAHRSVAIVLILLLVVFHTRLWMGRGSIPDVNQLQQKVRAQQAANATAREANDRLAAEVRDLREGLEMVEEKARGELGMVKPNEILVQLGR